MKINFAILGLFVTLAAIASSAATNESQSLALPTAKSASTTPLLNREAIRVSNAESNSPSVGVVVKSGPVELIRPALGGAFAEYGLQKVFFPLDARGEDALTITTSDGRILKCRATFLAAHDLKTDERWLIAEVTNRVGLIAGNDQVIYTNAFDTIAADIRYRYTKYSLEQDILLHENPPLPKGFAAENVRLEVWSEWFDAEPKAKITQALDLRADDAGLSAPSLIDDQTVDFGTAKIGAGHAFSSDAENDRTPVGKLWERIEGRDWLIEVVDYQVIQSKLEKLPAPSKVRTRFRRSGKREQLIRSLAKNDRPKTSRETMRLASSRPRPPEFVMDFVIVSTVPTPSGIISWWPGGGNAEDAINASNNDGTWSGTTSYVAGKVGQSDWPPLVMPL